jgi:predicted nuclease of predicted toxin-antitoxin system
MQFLADAGISRKTVAFLRLRGHDAVHVRELLLQRATDSELVDKARAESRVLLTFDLDFGEILALGVLKHPSVVIHRLAKMGETINAHRGAVVASSTDPPMSRMYCRQR